MSKTLTRARQILQEKDEAEARIRLFDSELDTLRKTYSKEDGGLAVISRDAFTRILRNTNPAPPKAAAR